MMTTPNVVLTFFTRCRRARPVRPLSELHQSAGSDWHGSATAAATIGTATFKKVCLGNLSTSSYQYEDPAVKPDDKDFFYSDWDILIGQRKAPPKGNALYSWTRFEQDLAALKKIGVTHYRFSISWPRVEPKPEVYNENAIRGYVDMARRLKAAGIEPVVCLWHFTFPSWLYDQKNPGASNWLHPLARPRWNAYVDKMVSAMAPYAHYYAPQNEPNGQIITAYIVGVWPPGMDLAFGHIAAIGRAIRDGYDVRGYFAWSLADNYEWHYGYKAFFGLARIDPQTYDRVFKPSAENFRQ